ncbi:FeoC-like transcriptional regulator [Sansalvadorimonas verongulae]|uniref:FeoC-like transcriptional regulator n=1 Tax=Sansalvadorimonas verongulae TaxID=2172824 RepID=UPI0012BC6C13
MVSLYELANHFDTEENVMSGMLTHWMRKGRVIRVESSCNQGCGGCDRASDSVWYQWVQSAEAVPALISLGTPCS